MLCYHEVYARSRVRAKILVARKLGREQKTRSTRIFARTQHMALRSHGNACYAGYSKLGQLSQSRFCYQVASFYFNFTWLRAKWHIRPQHSVTNLLCQPLWYIRYFLFLFYCPPPCLLRSVPRVDPIPEPILVLFCSRFRCELMTSQILIPRC